MLTKNKLTKPTFLKNVGIFLEKNVRRKNVGLKNVATFCKMLKKNYKKC
jgi:hypothetical protein